LTPAFFAHPQGGAFRPLNLLLARRGAYAFPQRRPGGAFLSTGAAHARDIRNDVREGLGGLRKEMHEEVDGLRKEMREQFALVHKELASINRRLDTVIQIQLDEHASRIKKLEMAVFAK
jgi:hypothetical protein